MVEAWLKWPPLPYSNRLAKLRKEIHTLVQQEIEKRRNLLTDGYELTESFDLLTLLLKLEHEISDQSIVEEGILFLVAVMTPQPETW